MKWNWKGGQPPNLRNRIATYDNHMEQSVRVKYEEKVKEWIRDGWLKKCEDQTMNVGIIPLMAVVQLNKDKVRPVMDFREVNEFVESHPGYDVSVCGETLRRWRRMNGNLKMVDLKSAYLQIRVEENLWSYQKVCFNGELYYLTRLGFGLCSAPKIMTKILNKVLSLNDRVRRGTDSYIDDIIVDEGVVSAEDVVSHLALYGLEAKPPESLDGGRVLGLSLSKNNEGKLWFKRGNELPSVGEEEIPTKRELFSMCGRLVGHYPVCGWLRLACSYVKRRCEGERWDDKIGHHAASMIRELISRVKSEDPVRGEFQVPPSTHGRVWCDASSLGIGVAVEIGGTVVEDAAWLRKRDDVTHINLAELEAVVKGLNLAMKWGVTTIDVMTDSLIVSKWLNAALKDEKRIRVSGLSEVLVRRRVSLVKSMVEELGIKITVTLVPSAENRADVISRVPKKWLLSGSPNIGAVGVDYNPDHEQHHLGVERSLYLTRMVDPSVKRKDIESAVRGCRECNTFDPAPAKHEPGMLSVTQNWKRLALDVTHFGQKQYFTVVDSGPSRFAVWRQVKSENASEICDNLEEMFRERGPPDQLLLDNGPAFRSSRFKELCDKWKVKCHFRAAYRASGNGIAERMHRTIKRMAARTRGNPLDMVFWYNLAAREGQDGSTAPSSRVYSYRWRHPGVSGETLEFEAEKKDPGYQVGDSVVVKPVNKRCTSRWTEGVVTGVVSHNNVEVDGVPRHVLDIRRLVGNEDERGRVTSDTPSNPSSDRGATEADETGPRMFREESSDDETSGDEDEEEAQPREPRRSARVRRPPTWLGDYEW